MLWIWTQNFLNGLSSFFKKAFFTIIPQVMLLDVQCQNTLATHNRSAINSEIMSNQQLAEELHKLIIRKVEKR